MRAHGPAHAVAQQIDLPRAGAAADEIDDVVKRAIDIVVERVVAVGVGWDAPVDQVDVESGLKKWLTTLLCGKRSRM